MGSRGVPVGGPVKTIYTMMTHRFDDSVIQGFHGIREALGPSDQACLLSDGRAQAPDTLAPWVRRFDFDRIAPRAARILGEDVLRNIHLVWIDFFEAHPDFDAYWFIEYDVAFSAPWSELFDAFRAFPCDLLCTHLRSFEQEPEWCWWTEVRMPRDLPAREHLHRGFLPIVRLSRRGMERLRDAVDEGWTGFMEGLVPTLFHASGMSLTDMGGDGPFVPEGFRNRFYSSVDDSGGSLQDRGTMRFRPPIPFPGILPGRLYHPVKPESLVLDATRDASRRAPALAGALTTLGQGDSGAKAELLLQRATGLGGAELMAALQGLAPRNRAPLRKRLLALRKASWGPLWPRVRKAFSRLAAPFRGASS